MNSLALWARRSRLLRTIAQPYLSARRRLADPGQPYREAVWESLSHLLAEDPVVNVDEFGGSFRLDARSHILKRLLLEGTYEGELVELCRSLTPKDRDAIDIGANAGFFSVLLARLIPEHRVLAAEPSRLMAQRLRSNLVRNGIVGQVIVFEGAVSNQPGTVELSGVLGKEEYGTIGTVAHPAVEAVIEQPGTEVYADRVSAEPLDTLVDRYRLCPGFIKVDTEGAEMLVFEGALATLRTFRPVVISELDDVLLRANGTSAMDVVRLLESTGYRVLDPFTKGHPPVTRDQLETPHVLTEVLCLPESLPS